MILKNIVSLFRTWFEAKCDNSFFFFFVWADFHTTLHTILPICLLGHVSASLQGFFLCENDFCICSTAINVMHFHHATFKYPAQNILASFFSLETFVSLFVYRDLPSTVMLSTTSTGSNFTEHTDESKRSAQFSEPHGLKTRRLSSVLSSFCHTLMKRVTGWQLAKHKCSAHDPLVSCSICGRWQLFYFEVTNLQSEFFGTLPGNNACQCWTLCWRTRMSEKCPSER